MLIYPLLCEIKAFFVKYICDTENKTSTAIREGCLIPHYCHPDPQRNPHLVKLQL